MHVLGIGIDHLQLHCMADSNWPSNNNHIFCTSAAQSQHGTWGGRLERAHPGLGRKQATMDLNSWTGIASQRILGTLGSTGMLRLFVVISNRTDGFTCSRN